MPNSTISELTLESLLEFPNGRTFDFAFNDLKTVKGSSMNNEKKFKNIEKLILGQNSSMMIEDGSLDGFYSLKKIDLRGNGILGTVKDQIINFDQKLLILIKSYESCSYSKDSKLEHLLRRKFHSNVWFWFRFGLQNKNL